MAKFRALALGHRARSYVRSSASNGPQPHQRRDLNGEGLPTLRLQRKEKCHKPDARSHRRAALEPPDTSEIATFDPLRRLARRWYCPADLAQPVAHFFLNVFPSRSILFVTLAIASMRSSVSRIVPYSPFHHR